jgi:uncharacterized protein
MILGENNERPNIEYPCEWSYKVIGSDLDNILAAIEDASSGLEYDVTPSNVSENEKYFSVNLKIKVPNEITRDIIYEKLAKHDSIRIVF